MKPTKLLAIVTTAIGLSIGAGQALAQEAATATEASASFSSTEVEQFAKAALAVQKINGDAALSAEDKQAKMAAAVTDSGLSPARFNEIATASQSDQALMDQIQTAAGKLMQAAAAETAGT